MAQKNKRQDTSWSSFSLAKSLITSLDERGFAGPMPIQVRVLKATLVDDKHVLGAARTGSGKTLAYLIPIVNKIIKQEISVASRLKRSISRKHKKKEDFELVDGEYHAIEDMIVDKLSDSADSDDGDIDSNGHDTSEKESSDNIQERICPEAIIMAPTRELAVQIKEEIDKLCSRTDIQSCCLIGGICQDKQVRMLKRRPHIVVATPGRLHDIVDSNNVEYLNVQSIASIQFLVIDEADRMVQKGHFEEMLKIIDILKESKSFRRPENAYRVYLFSATLTFLHELPDRFKKNPLSSDGGAKSINSSRKTKEKKLIDPSEHTKKNKVRRMLSLLGIERADTKMIDLNDSTNFGRPASEQLTELRINCLPEEKDLYLYYFLMENQDSRTLIFCNSKDCLRRLANVLKYLGYSTLTLHSEMDQKKRLSNLEQFRKRPGSVIVATDVAARGLDVKDLDCVVHYQVPKTCESYIHRSGRTARVFAKGISLTLCEPKEAPYYRRLCNNINNGQDLEMFEVDMNLKAVLKPRVNLAQQCDKLDHKLRETKSNANWFLKAAKKCEIELDDDDIKQLSGKGKSKQENLEESARDRRKLSQLQKSLSSMLKRPITTRSSVLKHSASILKDKVCDSP